MMETSPTPARSPWTFFALVVLLAAPLWALGAVTERGLLRSLRVNLPVSALGFACPLAAALILVYREERLPGVRRFLQRAVDPRRVRRTGWYVPVICLLPAIYLLSYGLMRLLGRPLPRPQTTPATILLLLAVFLVAAASEEVGWTGYATDPLQERWGALGASLIVGLVWAAVHVVPDIESHRTAAWIAGQRAYSVALRVLIVWLYNNTGKSVFAAILVHAMDNVSVFSLFPNDGDSRYDPVVTAALTATAAAVVTLVWGPKTLARYRWG